MPLRIPNPGSDVNRLVSIFRLIYEATRGQPVFDLDDMSRILTANLQASSRGAVGAAALARSSEQDRSRDPLYNQSKSYSEVFRMLGWLRPGKQRQAFTVTLLGAQIADDFAGRADLTIGLFRECLLGVTFPNPATINVGVTNHRPFRWLLLLAAELDGMITRNEMIIGLLGVTDDLLPGAFDAVVERVRGVRGRRSALAAAVQGEAARADITVNTLENYTRLPVNVLTSPDIGWGERQRVSNLYERPTQTLVLTTLGLLTAERLRAAVDVRESMLEEFSADQRAAFANYGHYAMLVRSGIDDSDVADELSAARAGCMSILAGLDIPGDPDGLLYSPFQQASDVILARAEEA